MNEKQKEELQKDAVAAIGVIKAQFEVAVNVWSGSQLFASLSRISKNY